MKIEKVFHRNQRRIKVELAYSDENIQLIKQVPGALWSQTMRSWHIPDSEESIRNLKLLFKEGTFQEKGMEVPLHKEPELPAEELQREIEEATNDQLEAGKIEIYQFARKIAVKMARNDDDFRFITSINYCKWNKKDFLWEIPNYKDNLEKLKEYFGSRIGVLTVVEGIDVPKLERTIHKNEVLCLRIKSGRVRIIGEYNAEIAKVVKKIPYYTWDNVNKWWTIPFSEKFMDDIKNCVKKQRLVFLYEEETEPLEKTPRLSVSDSSNYRLCPGEYIEKLNELRYSDNTVRSYKLCFEEFINYYPRHDIDRIDEPMIIAFIRYLVTDRKVSVSYQNVVINAIKFYYERVLGGQRKVYRVDRPITEKTLPVVLSEAEVVKVFKQVDNLKHKAILMLIYSAGLRIGEAIRMKVTDIDSKRNQVHIAQSKGKKDRYTLLSKKMVVVLRNYYTEYKPQLWLFEGVRGEQYSESSIQSILKQAVAKAGIKKRVTSHTLRHSFATHVLESGTDIRYIQSLLGHESSKTTEIYTHITTKGFDQIKNPLDGLDI